MAKADLRQLRREAEKVGGRNQYRVILPGDPDPTEEEKASGDYYCITIPAQPGIVAYYDEQRMATNGKS